MVQNENSGSALYLDYILARDGSVGNHLFCKTFQVPQHHAADINPPYKRPRLAIERTDLMRPLQIDTSATVEVKKVCITASINYAL